MAPLRVFSHYIPPQSLMLLAGDLCIFVISVLAGAQLFRLAGFPVWIGEPPLAPKIAAFAIIGVLTFFVADLYDESAHQDRKAVAARVLLAGVVWGTLYAALAFAVPGVRLARLTYLGALAVGVPGAIALRFGVLVVPALRSFRERLLFLGATPLADRLIGEVKRYAPAYEILGYVDDRPAQEVALSNGYRVLGTTSQLRNIASANQVGTIIVALEERRNRFPTEAILDCKLCGVRIEDWPTFYEKLTGKIVVQNLRPSWLLFSEGFYHTRITRVLKRMLDLLLSSAILVAGWLVFLLIAIAIKRDSTGPVFLRQERVGEGGKTFTLLKFRTMVQDAESMTGPVWATEDDPRITRVGRFLRKTRLDEFPQVLNVLKGEMSFIGPRPERPHFVARLQAQIPYFAQRHAVKPGITGWAQIRYRYGATIEDAEEKLQYDLYYIKNMSLFLDLIILLSSIQVVLFGKGAR
jgi:sugar transferase (PEP-CTERM system associated)